MLLGFGSGVEVVSPPEAPGRPDRDGGGGCGYDRDSNMRLGV